MLMVCTSKVGTNALLSYLVTRYEKWMIIVIDQSQMDFLFIDATLAINLRMTNPFPPISAAITAGAQTHEFTSQC